MWCDLAFDSRNNYTVYCAVFRLLFTEMFTLFYLKTKSQNRFDSSSLRISTEHRKWNDWFLSHVQLRLVEIAGPNGWSSWVLLFFCFSRWALWPNCVTVKSYEVLLVYFQPGHKVIVVGVFPLVMNPHQRDVHTQGRRGPWDTHMHSHTHIPIYTLALQCFTFSAHILPDVKVHLITLSLISVVIL